MKTIGVLVFYVSQYILQRLENMFLRVFFLNTVGDALRLKGLESVLEINDNDDTIIASTCFRSENLCLVTMMVD